MSASRSTASGVVVAERAEGDADARAGRDLGAADLERPAQRLLQPLGELEARSRCRRWSSARIANSSPPRRATTSPSARCSSMRRAAWTRNSSPTLWPRLSLISLKRSKSRNITPKRRCGRRRERTSAARQLLVEAVPVRQPGQAVVEGDVVQVGFGRLRGDDVLQLQDQARFDEPGSEKKLPLTATQTSLPSRCMQRSSADRLAAARRRSAAQSDGWPAWSCRRSRTKWSKSSRPAAVARQAEQLAQRCVGLPDRAVERDQRHADRRMRERAVEAQLAGLRARARAGGRARHSAACDARSASSASLRRKK